MTRRPSANLCLLLVSIAIPGVAVGQTTLRGLVLDSHGNPIPQAQVVVEPLNRSVTVGRLGDFLLADLPSGHFTILTRAIGFEPDRRKMSLNGRDSLKIEIRLRPEVQRLDSVVVNADARVVSPQMRLFEERRKAGFGRFITRDELRLRENATLTDVLRMVAGTRLVRRPERCGGGFALATSRGGEFQWQPWMACFDRITPFPVACYLTIYLDGVRIWTSGSLEPIRIDDFSVNAFEGIELYRGPAELPTELQATGSSCGAIVLWSRTGESP